MMIQEIKNGFYTSKLIFACCTLFICVSSVNADTVTIPKTFVTGDTLTATDLNDNNTAIKTAVDDNDTRINATSHNFMDYFVGSQAQTTEECSNWNKFRTNLQPTNYTCVQLIGSNGKGLTTCDATEVPNIATALRDGTDTSITVGLNTWNIGTCTEIEISSNTSGASGVCSCDTAHALRPCVGNSNWGNISDGATTSCNAASQSIQLIFR